ncbi:MAG: DUF2834 domain-containing protein, partial [Pseudomonadota bacterium]
MSLVRLIYLGIAIWGAIQPMYWFIQWFQTEGWDLQGLFSAWWVNMATIGLVWDLIIAATALTVFILVEVFVRRNWIGLLAIPATFCIGVSCGLPL